MQARQRIAAKLVSKDTGTDCAAITLSLASLRMKPDSKSSRGNAGSDGQLSNRVPTTFELAHISAILAYSERNKDKSAHELTQKAMELWNVAKNYQAVEVEKEIILATAEKMVKKNN